MLDMYQMNGECWKRSQGEVLLMHVVEVMPHLDDLNFVNEACKYKCRRSNISCLMCYGATHNAGVDARQELLLVQNTSLSTSDAKSSFYRISDIAAV